jgi:hypothetical protein
VSTIKVPVTIVYGGGSSPALNIWHGRMDADPPGTGVDGQVQDIIDALETFYTTIKSSYASGTNITIGEGTIIDPYGSPTYANPTPAVVTGTKPGGVEPALLAVTATWYTTSATKSGRGRTFLGPFGVDVAASDGTVAPTDLDNMRSAAAALVAASQGLNSWELGVYSPTQNLFRGFTAFAVRDRFAVMRSRR